MMETRQYKNTGKKISLLGLGCMRFPKISPDKEAIDYEKAQEIVDYAYTHGVNYFDTAYVYHGGDSEVFIGKALKKYPRESYNLATKMPVWLAKNQEDLERLFQEQLDRCGVDYFDFYLCHAMNAQRLEDCLSIGVFDFVKKKKDAGKIRHMGFSFHDAPAVLEEICNAFDGWDFAQIQLNYLDWTMQDAKSQYEILERHGIPCVVMEPVRGGTLASPCDAANKLFQQAEPDKSIASWAIRYAASLPNVLTVLSGMSTMEQVEDNVKTMTDFQPITEEEYRIIDRAVEAYRQKDTVPCTGCRYCMDCPFGVDIPGVFKVYNHYAVEKDKELFLKEMEQFSPASGPEHCVACGNCMKHCPQSIQIPEHMKEIQALYVELAQK